MVVVLASTAAKRVIAGPSAPTHELHEPSMGSADSAPRLISTPFPPQEFSADFYHAIERVTALTARLSARIAFRKAMKPWAVRILRSWTCPMFPTRPSQRLGPC